MDRDASTKKTSPDPFLTPPSEIRRTAGLASPSRPPPRDPNSVAEHIIEGDLNPAVGPFNFPGKLVVHGDIPDGVKIEANNGIDVKGVVGAAILRTHGDISIGRGASGQGYIEASRDIHLKFAENATLVCGRNLNIDVSAMHSRLSAGQAILVYGAEGVLVGGVAKAGVSISAAKIGSRRYTPTVLQVGIPPLLLSEHNRLTQRLNQLHHKKDAILKNAEYLEGLDKQDESEKMKARIGKLPLMRLHIKRLLEELNICNRRYETLRRVIEGQLGNGRIDTIKEIFPGVVMTIHWTTLTLREHLERVTFFERDGEIVWEALDGAQEAAVK